MTFSRNWLEQSDAAVEAFRNVYVEVIPKIREAIKSDPDGWNIPYHSFWGMGVRNFFRQEGFGEKYFGIDNMDCIYKFLIEDAVKE
jgi:hypothetical protein